LEAAEQNRSLRYHSAGTGQAVVSKRRHGLIMADCRGKSRTRTPVPKVSICTCKEFHESRPRVTQLRGKEGGDVGLTSRQKKAGLLSSQ
jgi:hypothetical protein